jgi:glycosyltransferase involved in cell wall biosynthesis
MNKSFDIIVLIPHFNNPSGLLTSLMSIRDFDNKILALIVDDGSKEKKIEKDLIIDSCNFDVDFLFLKKNLGIEYALNYGLEYIISRYGGASYIARLDCDDICMNNRLKIQYEFLEKNKDIGFIGSNVKFVDKKKKTLFNLKLPSDHEDIKRKMYLNAMFIHPTIFFRKKILKDTGLYPTNKKSAEDYAFFFNVIKRCKVANIPKTLVECVIDPDGISGKKRKQQVLNRINVIKDNFYFGFYPIYGLVRNIILLIIPRNLSSALKGYLKG